MAKTSNQQAYGRYDIIVFMNGGYECIGRQESIPPTPETVYRQKVEEFVAALNMPQDAGKWSMHYAYDGTTCTATWTPIDK